LIYELCYKYFMKEYFTERSMGRAMRVGLATLAMTSLAVGKSSEQHSVYAKSSRLGASGETSGVLFNNGKTTVPGEPCPIADPLGGVYEPERLRVVNKDMPCITVEGTIDCQFTAPDGDRHISLRLDKKYEDEGILTPPNRLQICLPFHLGRHLVAEVIPQHCQPRLLEPKANVNCADRGGFISPNVPRDGTHVSMMGTYVFDTGHFSWAEIHPVFAIDQTPKTS